MRTGIEYRNELTLMNFFIQESAAPGPDEVLIISAVESLSGYGPRAHLSGASHPLTLGEIAALQEDYFSDSDASTVLIEERNVSPVPEWSPVTATSVDPLYGHTDL